MSGLRAPGSGFAVGLLLSAVLAGCSSMQPTPPPVVEVCEPVADTYAGDGDPAGDPCGAPADGSR